jgi:bacterioferritin
LNQAFKFESGIQGVATMPETSRQEIIKLPQTACRMELETVTNYLANSIFLDDVDAVEVKRALASDVPEELHHAQLPGNRIKQLGGRIPGSLELNFDHHELSRQYEP